VESADPWITKETWDKNSGAVDLIALEGRACYGGLDLSKRDDLTALVLVFPIEEGDDETKDVLVFAWTPAKGIADREHRDKAPYQQWVNDGVLLTTPGPTIDYAFVARELGELTRRYDIKAVAVDHWHFEDLERELNAQGVDLVVVDHPQGFAGMNAAIEATEQDLINGRMRHGGNALLTWCVFNVKVEKNASALRAFEKRKATRRIDAAVSLAMADNISVTMSGQPQATYEVTII